MRTRIPKKKHVSRFVRHLTRNLLIIAASIVLVIFGVLLFWIGSFKIPSIESFTERKIVSSTKILDKTEEVVLFDANEDIKRTIIPYQDISLNAKNAIVAIEDDEFYKHNGIDVRATLRGIMKTGLAKFNIGNDGVQGGSTITQQVVKNNLLTSEKRISRKMKEWFLAPKLEKILSKDEILALYLNSIPYGGRIYGIQEASLAFFKKDATDLTIAESAYLAAIPNAPTFYSPYGQNRDQLEERKNLVLSRMRELSFITEDEYQSALEEEIEFASQEEQHAKALHFVQFIQSYLEGKYGSEMVENGGLKVITTLDWDLQKEAEEIIKKHALLNEEEWDAENAGLVAIDPQTGQILVMVGSRDYSDPDIDGNFNVTLAKRQPGSSFKPFAYATAFRKGYTPDTVVFDVRTQFSTACSSTTFHSEGDCYSPQNYNSLYKGPVSMRNGLAQSINVASVKTLYLANVRDTLRLSKDMGITTLSNPDQYGLTLVLGGGEVSLLEMTGAYSVFANNGVRNAPVGILRVEDKEGNILEEYTQRSQQVLDKNVALLISDVLSDNVARTPLFGPSSFLYFGEGRDVAGKTGTTNDNRDAWLVGYAPNLAVGVWTGNNDNSPMKRGSAISGGPWKEFMQFALAELPNERFEKPYEDWHDEEIKPAIRGIWQGSESVVIDSLSGKLATEHTPIETREELVITNPHSILYWIDRTDPRGDIPKNPARDSQYSRWETTVQNWLRLNPQAIGDTITESDIPTEEDDIHTLENTPKIRIVTPKETITYAPNDGLTASIRKTGGKYSLKYVDYFVNNTFIGRSENGNFSFTFFPGDVDNIKGVNELKAVAVDTKYNRGEATVEFKVF